jgi:uncharacterized protein involved in exopolysaccharide biosynthesis
VSDTNRNDPDQNRSKVQRNNIISLLDLVEVLAKRKRFIIRMIVIVALATPAVLISSLVLPSDSMWNLLPTKFKPTAKVLIQEGASGFGASSLLNQSGLSSVSGLLGGAASDGGTSTELAQALLKSGSLVDTVAEEFDLLHRYGFKRNPKTLVRKKLLGSMKYKYDDKNGIMEIGYEDIDREFATKVANATVDRLRQEFAKLTIGKALS